MKKKILLVALLSFALISFTSIDKLIATANTGNTDEVVEISSEPITEYTQTKQIIATNNIEESTERLQFCNSMQETSLQENINDILLEDIRINNTNEIIQTTTQNMSNEIDILNEKAVQNNKVGKTLYGEISADLDEEYLLAVIIFCEAGNQSYEGKVAVGNVVLNRVASPKFANTIEGVIRQTGQFSPVASGWYDKELAKGTVNESCMQAAKDALNGVNIVGDCLYFHRTNGSDPGIILQDHVFY